MKRNLIIDGQILQTDGWYRGMGKYLLQVLDELNRNYSQKTEIAILLNDSLPRDESKFETLRYLYPNIKIVHCDLPIPGELKRDKGAKLYKKKLNDYVNNLFPNTEKFYLLTSLFLFDFYTEFPDNCHKLVMFYDLTPLLFWKDLGGYFPQDLYMARFKRLYEAEHIFAISETTRQDLLGVFGLNPELVTNVNGGFIKIADKTKRPKDVAIPEEFILFPTGNLPHKNNVLTVEAFNQYCIKQNSTAKLLITSHFSSQAKRELLSLSKHIVFTDNVSDNELEWLYENAEAIIFSSKYEGLGMPILDAIANKKPVIASRIPVFEEMSKNAFYFFDPQNSGELESQIEQALVKHDFKSKLEHYPEIMDKYTWAKTTKKIHTYIEESTQNSPVDHQSQKSMPKKPRIAICSIHPGIGKQIGQLSERLYFNLRDNFQVDYYFDCNGLNFREMNRPSYLEFMGCKVLDITSLEISTYRQYDLVVYILDKAAIPSRVAQRAIVLPGMVISGSFSGIDDQAKLMEQLIFDNSICKYMYNARGFKECQDIVADISLRIKQQEEHPSPAMRILKNGGSKHSIISQLRRVSENDT